MKTWRISGIGSGWTLYQIENDQAKPILHATDRNKIIAKRDELARKQWKENK